jgi:hypothetical protein
MEITYTTITTFSLLEKNHNICNGMNNNTFADFIRIQLSLAKRNIYFYLMI